MSRYKPKVPNADLQAARSWIGKPVRDTRLDIFGLVHDVVEDKESVRLLALFPGERNSRKIALEVISNGEYLFPGDAHARYRPLSDDDRERLAGTRFGTKSS